MVGFPYNLTTSRQGYSQGSVLAILGRKLAHDVAERTWYMRFKSFFWRLMHPTLPGHMARYAFWLDIRPTEQGREVFWKGASAVVLENWSDFPVGVSESIYVVGTGPSVKKQDLTELNGDIALLNGAVTLLSSGQVSGALAVIVEDGRFVLERSKLLQGLPENQVLVLSVSALFAALRVCPQVLSNYRVFLMQGALRPWGAAALQQDDLPPSKFRFSDRARLSLDLSLGHFGCGTVMYAGVQLGFHLRKRRIALVGIDLTNFDAPRFYERDNDRAWSGVANAYTKRILPALELAADTADELGVELVNCSPASIIPRSLIPYSGELERD